MKTFFLLIPVLAFLSICNNSEAQNLNRIYKNIKIENIDEAYNDVDKWNGKISSLIELNELTIATYLIFSNEKFDECEPFKELINFQQLEMPARDKTKIEKFLKKYDYSFDIVLDIIYQNIVKFSKKQNTEAAYEKALNVCTPCNYSKELETLKEQAGYKETKDIGTIYAYNSFLNKYENSLYRTEISELLEKKAFEETKKIKSLYSINDFISRYPKSKFKGEAIDFRDLLALPKEPMSFDAVNDYIKKYPNSKLISKLKFELPEILYKEVLSENTIEIYKKFIDLYPNDRRIAQLKSKLEISYVEHLRDNFNLDEFNVFKSKFPNSNYLNEFISNNNENNSQSRNDIVNNDNIDCSNKIKQSNQKPSYYEYQIFTLQEIPDATINEICRINNTSTNEIIKRNGSIIGYSIYQFSPKGKRLKDVIMDLNGKIMQKQIYQYDNSNEAKYLFKINYLDEITFMKAKENNGFKDIKFNEPYPKTIESALSRYKSPERMYFTDPCNECHSTGYKFGQRCIICGGRGKVSHGITKY